MSESTTCRHLCNLTETTIDTLEGGQKIMTDSFSQRNFGPSLVPEGLSSLKPEPFSACILGAIDQLFLLFHISSVSGRSVMTENCMSLLPNTVQWLSTEDILPISSPSVSVVLQLQSQAALPFLCMSSPSTRTRHRHRQLDGALHDQKTPGTLVVSLFVRTLELRHRTATLTAVLSP